MSLDKETVRKIGVLARLEISEDEVEGLSKEMNDILNWFEKLEQVNTDGVAPMASVVNQSLHWRKDEITGGEIQDKVLANAPDSEDGYFLVPKVVE
jgi:aspartyl-tRNA(Asn)/glutamyl-tRNA(Gln) amidotransferase subunit C